MLACYVGIEKLNLKNTPQTGIINLKFSLEL